MQFVHQHTLHTAIQSNISLYVEEKPELGRLLAKIREEGRTTFMLTNNNYSNVDYLMRFIVPELPPGYPDWNSLFDVVMTMAGKPRFFTDKDRPFRQLNVDRDGVLWSPVKSLDRNEVYRDGCLTVRACSLGSGKRPHGILMGVFGSRPWRNSQNGANGVCCIWVTIFKMT